MPALGIASPRSRSRPARRRRRGRSTPGPRRCRRSSPVRRFDVERTFVNRSGVDGARRAHRPGVRRALAVDGCQLRRRAAAAENDPVTQTFTVTVPQTAKVSRPYFSRSSIQETRYDVSDDAALHKPYAESAAVRRGRSYEVDGVQVEIAAARDAGSRPTCRTATTRAMLAVVPAVAVTLTPATCGRSHRRLTSR